MIKAILACDEKGGIGKDNTMPWPHNSEDMKWFVDNTRGQVVVMGSGTWNSAGMPKPLPNRVNIVVTTDPEKHNIPRELFTTFGDTVCSDIQFTDKLYKEDVFIIGGANVIEQTLGIIEEFYITRIPGDYDCDRFLPLKKIETLFELKETIAGESVTFEIWSKRVADNGEAKC